MKILVADDDAVSRSLMVRMLVQGGYEVSTASNGNEAVELLMQENGPRMVLLDWMMPGLDGPEVCHAIRSGPRRAYTYITLLTSKDSKEDLVAGLEAGADDYLTKPCNIAELRARLRTGERILQLEDILIKAREEMRFKATHDALTLLLDRGAIIHALRNELENALHAETEFSVVLCDVDHFKRINDTFGHPIGDEVLQDISRRLKLAVRGTDSVGRFGGEEFLVILEGCGESGLDARAERICQAVQSTPILTSVGPMNVTVSAGALNIGVGANLYTIDLILQTVDAALYKAKADGRARIVTASSASATLMTA